MDSYSSNTVHANIIAVQATAFAGRTADYGNCFEAEAVTVTDNGSPSESDSETFILTVAAINDPPNFSLSSSSISVDEDFTTTKKA